WQFEHATSFSECLPDSQNASCRFVEWQAKQTAVFSAAVPYLIRFAGLFFTGSFRCSVASPWHAWHIEPLASLFAPWAVIAIEAWGCSWQPAQTGVGGPLGSGAGCVCGGALGSGAGCVCGGALGSGAGCVCGGAGGGAGGCWAIALVDSASALNATHSILASLPN